MAGTKPCRRNREKYNAYQREYQRRYYKAHPEKRREKTIRYALNLLKRYNYTLTAETQTEVKE